MEQDKKGLYSHPRWNDTSLPEIIGYTEPDPKEYEKDHEEFIEYLKKIGRKLQQLNISSTLQKCKVLF